MNEKEIKESIKKRNKGVCKTCGNEGVCWLLQPCPDCNEGRRVKRIGDRITKDVHYGHIIKKKGYNTNREKNKRVTKELNKFIKRNCKKKGAKN